MRRKCGRGKEYIKGWQFCAQCVFKTTFGIKEVLNYRLHSFINAWYLLLDYAWLHVSTVTFSFKASGVTKM